MDLLQYINLPVNPRTKNVDIPPGTINATHVHNNKPKLTYDGDPFDGTVKMPSPTDVLSLITTCYHASTASGLTPYDSFVVMVSGESIFAISLTDSNIDLEVIIPKFAAFRNYYSIESQRIIENINWSPARRKKELQIMMLTGLEALGVKDKVGLFEGFVNPTGPSPNPMGTESNPTFNITWTKNTYDAKTKNIIPTPCN